MNTQAWMVAGMAVAMSSSMAMAQMGPGNAGAPRPNRQAMMEQYDEDGDGVLSDAERQAMREARFDTDGDGVLSDTEREAMEARGNRRGRPAAAEAPAATPPVAVAPMPARPNPAALMKQFDANGDGALNEAELTALLGSMPARRGAPANTGAEAAAAPQAAPTAPTGGPMGRTRMTEEERMERFDTDKDGTISEEERTAMRETMRAERAARSTGAANE